MRKTSEKKLLLGKLKLARLNSQQLHAGKDVSLLVVCPTAQAAGCFPTHYNTCGDCVPTFVNC
ncbi:hypothetical protein [Chitinophaga vietnamensis]|uniref:hypothetical protein n=1 Tax=Chitinophaga vietnamensis TaxID=2593957 RepID=UPI00117875F0|nr:hypothetical protein [Chitinophaga vietnamensis]